MKLKSFAVIDTNVIVSGLLSSGFPRIVLDLIKSDNVIPVFDKRMLAEYYDVLCREKMHFSDETIYDTVYLMVDKGIYINDVERAKKELKDKGDIPFFEVKESSRELDTYLVTGNLKDFPDDKAIITPKEFLNVLNTLEHFVALDFEYEKMIQVLIATQVSTPKYKLGKELVNTIFDTPSKKVKDSYFRE